MADNSKIEWTDTTWNVALGCDRVSPGCDGCYAIPQAHIRASNPHPKIAAAFARLTEHTGDRLDWTGKVNLMEERLNQPFNWRKPRKVFVNSLADLFHDKIPADFISDVFAVMALTPQHTYQILTKRPGPMRSLLNKPEFWYQVGRKARHLGYSNSRAANHLGDGSNIYDTTQWETRRHLDNVWLGVSVEDQQRAELRIPALLETPAAVRFLSCEPLLGPVNLRNLKARNRLIDCLGGDVTDPSDGAVICGTPSVIDWVIVGGESGPGARPMHPGWARRLRDQCQGRAAFHFKQWGAWGPAPFIIRVCDPQVGWRGTEEELVEAKRRSEAAGATHVHTGNWYIEDGQKVWGLHEIGHKPWSLERVGLADGMEPVRRWGKKAAGRELDGRTWDEFPNTTPLEVAHG